MYINWIILLVLVNSFTNVNLKKVKITVTSINCALDHCKDCGSEIIINSKHRSQKHDGINIAIMDPFTGKVMSSASFSSAQSRQFRDFIDKTKTGYIIIATSQLLCTQEKATNLHQQKSIIFAFEKLGVTLPNNIQAVIFGSGVYIFCKNYCHKELRTNIKLPVEMFKTVSDDPILISFSMDTLPCIKRLGCQPVHTTVRWKTMNTKSPGRVSNTQAKKKKREGISLLLIATMSPLVVVGLISLFVFLYIRHRYKVLGLKKSKRQDSKISREKIPLNENAMKFCECRKNQDSLTSESISDRRPLVSETGSISSPHSKHTSSFRLFHKPSDQVTDSPKHKLSFATYVTASEILEDEDEHDDTCIYKVPSSIRRHAPPKHLPPSCAENDEPIEYVDFSNHDYASLDEVGYICSPSSINETSDSDVFVTPENSNETSDSDVFVTPENSNGDLITQIHSTLAGYNKAKELYERASLSLSAMSSSHLTSGSETLSQNQYDDYEESYMHPT